ncbi:MAG TPA: hypothetical protein PK340_02815 [Bacilli bacterium]|nr:hypothetical protein [Bacilli bacterium]
MISMIMRLIDFPVLTAMYVICFNRSRFAKLRVPKFAPMKKRPEGRLSLHWGE